MIYAVLQPIKFRTSEGIKEFGPGQAIDISPDKARKLLEMQRIMPFIPEPCQGCWAEDKGMCYALIKGRICYSAICKYKH